MDFIASDCHKGRRLCLDSAIKYVAKKCGTDVADELFYLNASAIIDKE